MIYLALVNLLKSEAFVEMLESGDSFYKSIEDQIEKFISIGNSNCHLTLNEDEKRKIIHLHQSLLMEFLSIKRKFFILLPIVNIRLIVFFNFR